MPLDNRDPEPCPEGECRHSYDEQPANSVTRSQFELDQCSNCGWTKPERDALICGQGVGTSTCPLPRGHMWHPQDGGCMTRWEAVQAGRIKP